MTTASATAALTRLFNRNGYVRIPDPDRAGEGSGKYKKGYEVRLVAESSSELTTIRQLLRAVKLDPGKPFLKNKHWCLPIYGREATERFIKIVGKKKKN
jgi:hypothetical protein